MIEHTYTEPVSKLLTLGRPKGQGWPDYLQMGFTREHIPELIRLLEDKELRWMERPADLPEDGDLTEWYGQIHAWRVLAQLKAEEAIPALLNTLQEIDDYQDDWYGEDSFLVFPMIGLAAIRPLAEYLADIKHGTWARVAASSSLEKMAEAHPETKEECVTAIVSALQSYKDNDESLNGSLISDLMEMNIAREHIGLIEKAFKADRVDEFIDGDFEDIQVRLGLIEKRAKPRPRPIWFDEPNRVFTESNAPKVKASNKKEKKSRKRHRKR